MKRAVPGTARFIVARFTTDNKYPINKSYRRNKLRVMNRTFAGRSARRRMK